MYTVRVSDKFSAAHRILEYNGSCERLHGHTWKVELEVRGAKLDHLGLLIDFRDVKKHLRALIKELDHSFLNEHPYFAKINPTAENIAKFIYDIIAKEIKGLYSVYVWESENTVAIYNEG